MACSSHISGPLYQARAQGGVCPGANCWLVKGLNQPSYAAAFWGLQPGTRCYTVGSGSMVISAQLQSSSTPTRWRLLGLPQRPATAIPSCLPMWERSGAIALPSRVRGVAPIIDRAGHQVCRAPGEQRQGQAVQAAVRAGGGRAMHTADSPEQAHAGLHCWLLCWDDAWTTSSLPMPASRRPRYPATMQLPRSAGVDYFLFKYRSHFFSLQPPAGHLRVRRRRGFAGGWPCTLVRV